MIPNYYIRIQDIMRTEDILWPNLGSIKGQTTRQPTQHINFTW